MRTPINFSKNLNNNIITSEMLATALYSVNKRAKNCRDNQMKLKNMRQNNRYFRDKYDSETTYREKKLYYYSLKDTMLKLCSPSYIHALYRYSDFTGGFYEYFLLYELAGYSFHQPIDEQLIETNYSSLEKIEVNSITTCGRDINDLISVQFVEKLIALIKSGNYTYIA